MLESSHRNIGFSEEIAQEEPIEVNSVHLIWSSARPVTIS